MDNVLSVWKCSFCGRTSSLVSYLVTSGQPFDAAICEDCIETCREIIELKKKEETEQIDDKK